MFRHTEDRHPSEQSLNEIEAVASIIDKAVADERGRRLIDPYLLFHKERLAFDLDYAHKYIGKERAMLEIGASPFILTSALKRQQFNSHCVDIAPEDTQQVCTIFELEPVKCNVETEPLPFPEGSFDAIVFNETFEHLRINPIFTFHEVKRVLKPGGRLLLSTPNLLSVRGVFNFLVKGRATSYGGDIYEEFVMLDDIGRMGHIREYTSQEVCEFLQRIGLHPEGVIFRGRYKNPLNVCLTLLRPQLKPFFSVVARHI